MTDKGTRALRWIRQYARDAFIDGPRALCSGAVWRAFRDYYRPAAITARLDAWARRVEDRSKP